MFIRERLSASYTSNLLQFKTDIKQGIMEIKPIRDNDSSKAIKHIKWDVISL